MAMFIPESVQTQHELKVVTEAYIGDKPIEPMLKQLHKLREPYVQRSGFIDKFINEFNTDPELFKFNRMLEDFFGFKACSITCINDAIVNGCTYPVSFRNFGSGKNLVSTSNGFKFKKEAEYCLVIYVYSGCILSSDFTDREIMGMILHEIGHNFSSAINGNLCSIRDMQHFISIPTRLLQVLLLQKDGIYSFNNTTKVALNLQEKFKKEYPDLCNFVDHFKGCFNILGFILRQIYDIYINANIILNPIGMLIGNICYYTKNDYKDHKKSCKFIIWNWW